MKYIYYLCVTLTMITFYSINLDAKNVIEIDNYYTQNTDLLNILDSISKFSENEPAAYVLQFHKEKDLEYCSFMHFDWPKDLINQIKGEQPLWGTSNVILGCINYNNLFVYIMVQKGNDNNIYKFFFKKMLTKSLINNVIHQDDDLPFLYRKNLNYIINNQNLKRAK